MNEFLETLLGIIRDLDPLLRTLVAGFGMFLETSVLIGLIVPGDSIALLSSVGVSSMPEYFWLVAALVLGALGGESFGFFIGKTFGPRLRHSRLGTKLGERNWSLAERYLGRRGGPAVFLSRFLPVLHSLVPITAAMSGMRYRKFLAWTIPACLIWAFTVVTIGYSAALSFEELSRKVSWAGYVVVAAGIVVLALVWLGKKLVLRLERRHMSETEQEFGRNAELAAEAAAGDRGPLGAS
ncbi:DedA family protein, partial [Leucobacter sp. M11]|uniref:DedA family protein n=1 Tax=Leucobacter sp. M11 TaxID=2993565 RepID=UPI002D800BBD